MLLVLEVEADSFILAGISSALDFSLPGIIAAVARTGHLWNRVRRDDPGDSREQLTPVAWVRPECAHRILSVPAAPSGSRCPGSQPAPKKCARPSADPPRACSRAETPAQI